METEVGTDVGRDVEIGTRIHTWSIQSDFPNGSPKQHVDRSCNERPTKDSNAEHPPVENNYCVADAVPWHASLSSRVRS